MTKGGWFQKLRAKLRQHLLFQVVLDRLKAHGLHIIPYYLFLEGRSPEGPGTPPDAGEQSRYETCLLRAPDMQALHHIDGRTASADELVRRLTGGHLCFGIKQDGNVAGFTWVNLLKCDFEGDSFELSDDEAYLCDMHIVKAYRGQNAAVYLRQYVYATLEAQGRHRFYSMSERFNCSAIRFKEKLGARVVKSCLYIRLFDWVESRWVIWENRDELRLSQDLREGGMSVLSGGPA